MWLFYAYLLFDIETRYTIALVKKCLLGIATVNVQFIPRAIINGEQKQYLKFIKFLG